MRVVREERTRFVGLLMKCFAGLGGFVRWSLFLGGGWREMWFLVFWGH